MLKRRALLAAPLLASPALAQERFPNRPIRLVIPVAVAGVTDIVGRILAEAMGPLLGRPVVPENIAGAGSTVAAQAFQRTPADGHTIFLGTNNHAVMKTIYPQSRMTRWRISCRWLWSHGNPSSWWCIRTCPCTMCPDCSPG